MFRHSSSKNCLCIKKYIDSRRFWRENFFVDRIPGKTMYSRKSNLSEISLATVSIAVSHIPLYLKVKRFIAFA